MTLIRILKGYREWDLTKKHPIYVAFTSDDRAETLSVGVGKGMATLPYGPIEKMVERERAKGYTWKGHYIIDETKQYVPIDWMKEYVKQVNGEFSYQELVEAMIHDWEEECYEEFEKEAKEDE